MRALLWPLAWSSSVQSWNMVQSGWSSRWVSKVVLGMIIIKRIMEQSWSCNKVFSILLVQQELGLCYHSSKYSSSSHRWLDFSFIISIILFPGNIHPTTAQHLPLYVPGVLHHYPKIYPSQRQNLLPTLKILTQNFENFHNFQNFGKKFPKSRIFFQNFQYHKGAANDIKGAAASLLVNSKISIFNWELP